MSLLALVAAAALSAAPSQSPYRMMSWSTVARDDAAPGLVRLSGRYLPYARGQGVVRGVLASDRFALRVEGEVSDWAPRAGEAVELWGALERDERGLLLLRFHSGRRQGDTRRRPGAPPTPPSSSAPQGPTTRLWLRVTQTGSEPLPMNTGVTEDGQRYTLPPAYAGPFGEWVCLEGTVGTLGQGRTLRDPRPCPPGTPRR